jgi:hypothetical protein
MNGEFQDNLHRDDALGEAGLNRALGRLPAPIPPPGLTKALRVVALRERQRKVSHRSLRHLCADLLDRAGLSFANVMRPMALPVAGGVFSAVLLFGMWLAPTYPVHAASGAFDVPIMLTVATDPMLRGSAPLGLGDGNIVVEVSVDDQGHMVDYKVVSGQSSVQDASFRRRLENALLFTVFAPATSFGQRTSGKIRVSFVQLPAEASSIVVKG